MTALDQDCPRRVDAKASFAKRSGEHGAWLARRIAGTAAADRPSVRPGCGGGAVLPDRLAVGIIYFSFHRDREFQGAVHGPDLLEGTEQYAGLCGHRRAGHGAARSRRGPAHRGQSRPAWFLQGRPFPSCDVHNVGHGDRMGHHAASDDRPREPRAGRDRDFRR